MIAGCCLRIMCDNLKFNICDLPRSEWSTDRTQLHDRIDDFIPPHLAYACTYWATHLIAGLNLVGWNNEVCGLLERFATCHLLNWLEALSIIGRVATAFTSLETTHAAMVCHISCLCYSTAFIDPQRLGCKFAP